MEQLSIRKFNIDELNGNKFFELIVGSFFKDLHNFGHKHYGENFTDNDLFDNISLILNQFYLLKNKVTSVIQFDDEFLKLKKKSENGDIIFKDIKGNDSNHTLYKGHFVYYSVMIDKLFHRYFSKELNDKDDYLTRLSTVIRNNYLEIDKNPLNFPVIQNVSKVFEGNVFTPQDITDYTDLLLNELNSQYSFEVENIVADLDNIEKEELDSVGLKIMFMMDLGITNFLIEKYQLKGNTNQLSKIISTYTGLNQKTINGILNVIFNTANIQKNNPYKNNKNVLKVKAKMVELGLS